MEQSTLTSRTVRNSFNILQLHNLVRPVYILMLRLPVSYCQVSQNQSEILSSFLALGATESCYPHYRQLTTARLEQQQVGTTTTTTATPQLRPLGLQYSSIFGNRGIRGRRGQYQPARDYHRNIVFIIKLKFQNVERRFFKAKK